MLSRSPASDGGRYAVGVVVHPSRPVADSLATVARWASAHGADVLARERDRDLISHRTVEGAGDATGDGAGDGTGGASAPRAPHVHLVDDADFVARVDAVVSLGGDGTMLGALRLVAARPVPVLGVNHGTLGFLVELTPAGLEDALAQLVQGRYTVEPHHGLRVERDGDRGASPLEPSVAFNDVVLTRRNRQGGVSVDLEINGDRYGYYRCDAVVVATPTGSTAYSYAAGGPVLSPSVAATVVTPVAPMSGIARPVVFAADDVVSLHVRTGDQPVDVDVDGVAAGSATGGHAVTVLPLADPAQVVRLDTGAHERRSRVRLSLLDLPLRGDQLRELVPPDLRRHLEAGHQPR